MTIETIDDLNAHARRRLETALAEMGARVELTLSRPPSPELGDVALACFPMAKALRRSPSQIATELAERVVPDRVLSAVSADKGYLNLSFDPAVMARVTLQQVLAEATRFGAGQASKPWRYVVEYSSPNTNKPLHLGHVRNNVLGLSACRILAHAGHDVVPVCLVNDRGIHICKTMVAYQKWGAGRSPQQTGLKGDHFVGDLYVEFARRFDEEYDAWLAGEEGRARKAAYEEARAASSKRARRSFKSQFEDEYFNTLSPLGSEARRLLRQWESEDRQVRALWARMNQWVYDGFDATYRRLGVVFDRTDHESQTYLLGRRAVEEGLRVGHFRRLEDGAVVCDYGRLGVKSPKVPHKVLLRSDGTTVYTTQDLGTALARDDALALDRQVYVVGDEQKHHFEVLFALLGLMRPKLAGACRHLAYGMVNLPHGKMKSREGDVVDADALMDELAALARKELRARSASGRAHSVAPSESAEADRRAEVIAQAALKFYLLSFAAASSVQFDPARSIDFTGRTGPYCLNAYARAQSVLARAPSDALADDIDSVVALASEPEMRIVRALASMPAALGRAESSLDPARVAEATYEVARAFNQLYTDKEGHPIVSCLEPRRRRARLLLTRAAGLALRTGLWLLGIEVLEEM